MSASVRRIVVVGAGFGGLQVTLGLANQPGVEVLLIDRRNHHLFQPLLYQVAMAALSPADIATPIRSIVSGARNVTVQLGEVLTVDRAAKTVTTDFGVVPYDLLVLACGATHSYFGHDVWEDHAPGLKTLEQATEIRRRVLTAFELAEREQDPARQRQLLTFVVVGGGPTGVELAGALGEISRFTLQRDFRHIDPARTRVVLIEGGPRLLAAFDPALAEKATRSLEALGVSVWTSSRVEQVTAEGVVVGGETLRAATVIWAAGVKPSPLGRCLGTALDKSGRVIVGPDLALPEDPCVFVIGDQAAFVPDGAHEALPGLAPVAIQEGRFVAKTILRETPGKPRPTFRYFDKGMLATIGRSSAIMQAGHLKMSGFIAWLAWLFVHIYYLIGFRNRLVVLFNWAWSYLAFRRGARLIVSKSWKLGNEPKAVTEVAASAATPFAAAAAAPEPDHKRASATVR
jgi:NADH dehydrogenase